MSKVYILFHASFEGDTIVNVFSTKELAFKHKEDLDNAYTVQYGVKPTASYGLNTPLYHVETHKVIEEE